MIALDFEIAKSIRYHSKRCAFFEGINHLTRGASAIFAAGAIISIVGNSGVAATIINAILAVALAADLVVLSMARPSVRAPTIVPIG